MIHRLKKQGLQRDIHYFVWIFWFDSIRIRSELNGWCPLNRISKTTYEYLQIDLVNLTVVTLIELQGKFGLEPVRDEWENAD